MIAAIVALFCGALFSTGLLISGLARPSKVRAVLDFAGNWDPTMMLVMCTGTGVCAVVWRFARPPRKPPFGDSYPGPSSKKLDLRLIGGAAIFGVGWGISGLCPGTSVPMLATLLPGGLIFAGATLVGMVCARLFAGTDLPTSPKPVGSVEEVEV